MKQLKEKMRLIREEKGLTQAKLAEKLGITQGALATKLNNLGGMRISTLFDIADALGVSVEEFFSTTKNENKQKPPCEECKKKDEQIEILMNYIKTLETKLKMR